MNDNKFTGFMVESPVYFSTKAGGTKYCTFTLVVNNGMMNEAPTMIPCIVYGDRAEKVAIKGLKGTLWSFVGSWRNHGHTYFNNKKYPICEFVVKKAKLYNTPALPSISIQEVLENWSPEGIAERFGLKSPPKKRGRKKKGEKKQNGKLVNHW